MDSLDLSALTNCLFYRCPVNEYLYWHIWWISHFFCVIFLWQKCVKLYIFSSPPKPWQSQLLSVIHSVFNKLTFYFVNFMPKYTHHPLTHLPKCVHVLIITAINTHWKMSGLFIYLSLLLIIQDFQNFFKFLHWFLHV